MSSIANVSKKLLTALAGSVSARAVHAASPVEFKAADSRFTKKRGKRGQFGSRFICYERLGPFQNQTGERRIGGQVLPIMQQYFKHRILHATKGWRTYIAGPGLRMPMCPVNKSYPTAFFGPNHKFA